MLLLGVLDVLALRTLCVRCHCQEERAAGECESKWGCLSSCVGLVAGWCLCAGLCNCAGALLSSAVAYGLAWTGAVLCHLPLPMLHLDPMQCAAVRCAAPVCCQEAVRGHVGRVACHGPLLRQGWLLLRSCCIMLALLEPTQTHQLARQCRLHLCMTRTGACAGLWVMPQGCPVAGVLLQGPWTGLGGVLCGLCVHRCMHS